MCKMGLTSATRLLRFVTFVFTMYVLCMGHSAFLSLHLVLYVTEVLHVVLQGEIAQMPTSRGHVDRAMANDFQLIVSQCRFDMQFDTLCYLPCSVFFWLIRALQHMFLNLQAFALEGLRYMIVFYERVAYFYPL